MINPWKNLSWTWSPNETLSTTECDSVIDEVTTQIPSPEAMAVVNPPMKRSRKKKLKFDDTPRESLNRQFDKIASGQTVRFFTFFLFGAVSCAQGASRFDIGQRLTV